MLVTEYEVHKIINESSITSYVLDAIPIFLLKECLAILLLSITKFVNYSLTEGSLSGAFKQVVVTPLIKKFFLPRNELKKFHPVCGLCFLSKLGV